MKTLRTLRWLSGNERGSLLLEALVALVVLGIAGSAVLSSVQTSVTSKASFGDGSVVENVIRNQVEYVFQQEYLAPVDSYLTITPPAGYGVTAEALDYNGTPNIATVRVTVYRNGAIVRSFDVLRSDR
ncbi:MAG: hypothetical protein WD645_00900 [Dehalococcoidia bacterium]